ncbi:MAG: phosphatidylglycerophosphatase A [Desulfovibrio sp.]|nr:phosphatidylglycerophosphatase A [Desulfovibrio sp.]
MRVADHCILAFCRLGIAGLAPRAPGTWGTAMAALLAPWLFLPLAFGERLLTLSMVFILGALAATRAEKLLGRKDPGQVVIDELLGLWLALLPFATADLWLMTAAFILFRIFDIAKPWPVRASENWLPAGFGVMLDDALAGLWAMLCLGGLHCLSLV